MKITFAVFRALAIPPLLFLLVRVLLKEGQSLQP